MTNKELKKYNWYKFYIKQNEIEISDLRSKGVKCTSSVNDMPPSGGSSDKIGNLNYDKILALQAENENFERKVKDIEDFINSITNPKEKSIFRLRIYLCLEWDEVANEIIKNFPKEKNTTEDSVRKVYERYLEKNS